MNLLWPTLTYPCSRTGELEAPLSFSQQRASLSLSRTMGLLTCSFKALCSLFCRPKKLKRIKYQEKVLSHGVLHPFFSSSLLPLFILYLYRRPHLSLSLSLYKTICVHICSCILCLFSLCVYTVICFLIPLHLHIRLLLHTNRFRLLFMEFCMVIFLLSCLTFLHEL